ncbi:MAG: GNAT family N-acetyltransferase, partial [candidate division Zixibacteria bacterium]|nr:GNAT family N-acetyltransferase [candidate division Zixibacteria bacterium]
MSLTNKKQQLNIKIKGFKNEYQEISEINNSVYSDRPISPEEFIEFDTNRNKKCKHRRWIAIIDNKIVGTGVFTQEIWQYHPDKFYIWMMVKPEYQNIGVGSKLYDRIWKSLEKFNPISVNTDARNDMPQADRFIKERGYKSFQRYAEPHLEVSSFDFAPYESLMEKIKSEGIIIKTMQELENDPDRNHKIYEMDQEIAADMPDEDGFTKLDYETYRKENLEASYTNPDSYFIA